MKRKTVVGILAHVDSGKTTLSEALLYETGVIKEAGRVDLKNAFLDTYALEKERGITIYSKNARITYNNTEFILIDTPGHVDFSTEMERSLSVLDIAILLVSASEGVQSHTKTLWSLLKTYKIPTFIFVNKMDMNGVSKSDILNNLKSSLSSNIVDFSDIGSESFYEDVATSSEHLLNTFLSDGSIPDSDIVSAIAHRNLFPVSFGSALKLQGISEFLNVLSIFSPSVGNAPIDDFSARVYKISRDASGKRLTFLKILSGSLKLKSMLNEEKVNELRLYSGEKYENVSEVLSGDICAVVGIMNSKNGDFYGNSINRTINPVLSPALSYAVHFPLDIDKTTMLSYLKLLEEEDPSLNIEYKEQTREIFVSLMGDIQSEILKRTINDRFGINVSFSDGKICYKETIDSQTEGVGHFEPLRHYAEVHIKLEPLERGSGIEIASDLSEDLLSKNWQRLILTHLLEKEHKGVLTGSPITDVKMTLVAGKAHIKHTEGGDFRQATYRAIRQGLMNLYVTNNVRLLEPYYSYTLEVPDEYTGRAMTDISAMSGTTSISENDIVNHITVLTGKAPVSTMNGYVKEVASYSKGQGRLYLSLCGYELCHNEEEVLANSHYDPDSDLRNPSASVFCSHGAGTIITWDQVPQYMHLPYSYDADAFNYSDIISEANAINCARKKAEKSSVMDMPISLEEIDEILRQNSHANDKGRQGSYKGISEAMKNRRRQISFDESNNSSKYKGAKIKEKYLLVDGYNVIHAFEELSDIAKITLDGASSKLNDILCNYQAIKDINLMVVYDAYKVKGHPLEISQYKNITVIYTREAQTADQYIERYSHENSSKYDITVVTSDGLEQIIVAGNGANIISSREFEEILKDTFKSFNEKYDVK